MVLKQSKAKQGKTKQSKTTLTKTLSNMSTYNVNTSSEVGEDLYNQASNQGGSGVTREVPRAVRPIGYVQPLADPRLVSYDRLAARSSAPVLWEATKDDRMSAVEAGMKMRALYDLYGLRGESPEVLEAFHDSMYFSHTLNGASVLQPGRAKLIIGGNPMDYSRAVNFLGPDLRRFNRAYAGEIRSNNKRILSEASDPSNIVAMEKAALLRQVAAEKGLSRFPDLAHDSADACLDLTDAEVAALTASKAMIFSSGENMADRNRARPGQSGSTSAGSMFISPTARGHALADA